MKLGIYVPIFDQRPAGLGTYVLEVCTRLVQRHSGNVVLWTSTPDTVPESMRPHVQIRGLGAPSLAKNIPGISALQRLFDLGVRLSVLCVKEGVDVLFCPATMGPLHAFVPQVVVTHDLTPLVHPSSFFSIWGKLYVQFILPKVLGTSHTIVAVSQHTAKDLTHFFGHLDPRDIQVITEGFDQETYLTPTQERLETIKQTHNLGKRPYIMYAGTFAGHKNVQLLPQVLRQCLDQGVELDLVFTGRTDAGAFDPIKDAIHTHHVQDHVHLLGYVPRDHLAPLMSGAAAFLFPSLYEGFGLAPLEAMASGALVLCSDRASLSEVVQSGGVLLNPQDPWAWSKALMAHLEDPELDAAQRQRALAQAKKFNWEDATDELDACLSYAASNPPKSHTTP